MAISFDLIPSTLRLPGAFAEFDDTRAMQGAAVMAYRVLLIGQKLAAGTQPALTPVRVTNPETARTLFGSGSMLYEMCAAYLEANSYTEMVACALEDDPAAVAASGTLTFSGSATESGTIALYVAGTRVRAGVTAGQAAADVAAAVAAAVNAVASLPVTCAAAGAVLTFTSRHKGEAGNGIDLRLNNESGETLPAGITATITAMSGGTANPELADLIAALGDVQYHVVAMPYTDSASLSAMEQEMEDRWGPMRAIEGMVVTAARGTQGTLGALGDSRNSQLLCISHCAGIPQSPWQWAAAVAGVLAYYAGIDPARPFQTLEVPGVTAPRESDRFTNEERNLLLWDGISTFIVDSGGSVRLERLITTYKQNAAGADSTAYLNVNNPLVLMYLRYAWRTWMLNRYPRHKLADDGTRYGVGQAVVTPKVAKAENVAWFRAMEDLGLVEGADQFKAELVVERNPTDRNRLDFLLPPDLMNQLITMAAKIQFLN